MTGNQALEKMGLSETNQSHVLTFQQKLERFAQVLEKDQLRGLVNRGVDCEGNRNNCVTRIVAGSKYTKVDVGKSGKYMVVNATGEIYGIKGYGVIHRGQYFGTLDTIDRYDWSGYRAFKKTA